jgi:hypothetical protein
VRYARRSTAIAALLIAGLSMAGMPDASAATSHRITSRPVPAVSIPKGWQSYAYGGVTISDPKSWAVKHNMNCRNTSAPGVLLLGYPKELETCLQLPHQHYSDNYVAIYASTAATTATGAPIRVNSLTVAVGFGSRAQLEWNIPSFGLQVVAGSSKGERILHTLRRS